MLLSVVLAALCNAALAQTREFPQRPIRIVVPVPPGGSVDAVTRLIAPRMSETLSQTIVIDNRAGASTNIGMELVARATADGHTLLANTIPIVANPALFRKLTFSPEKDLAPISLIVNGPSVIVVHPAVAVRNVAELVAAAKAKPGLVKYSSSGPGTLTHLGAELFKYLSRVDLAHVPYKGGGPALAAVVAGECEVSFQTPLAASGQIAAGRLRAIAVTSTKRLPILPDVPTVAESGVARYEFQSWVGLLAPSATPAAVVKTLNEHAVRAARAPDIAERFARDGAEVVASSPEDFRRQITDEVQLWARVIREMGIKSD
jgi:tripartite-type tricarboxylate transporter receptor subunit TctC